MVSFDAETHKVHGNIKTWAENSAVHTPKADLNYMFERLRTQNNLEEIRVFGRNVKKKRGKARNIQY